MDLDQEWEQKVEENFLQEEEQKEEGYYQPKKISKMIKFKSFNQSNQFLNILKKKKIKYKIFYYILW